MLIIDVDQSDDERVGLLRIYYGGPWNSEIYQTFLKYNSYSKYELKLIRSDV